jgi:hypothetical protein
VFIIILLSLCLSCSSSLREEARRRDFPHWSWWFPSPQPSP